MSRKSVKYELEQELNNRILQFYQYIDTQNKYNSKESLQTYFIEFMNNYHTEYKQTHSKDDQSMKQINILDKIYAYMFPFVKNAQHIIEEIFIDLNIPKVKWLKPFVTMKQKMFVEKQKKISEELKNEIVSLGERCLIHIQRLDNPYVPEIIINDETIKNIFVDFRSSTNYNFATTIVRNACGKTSFGDGRKIDCEITYEELKKLFHWEKKEIVQNEIHKENNTVDNNNNEIKEMKNQLMKKEMKEKENEESKLPRKPSMDKEDKNLLKQSVVSTSFDSFHSFNSNNFLNNTNSINTLYSFQSNNSNNIINTSQNENVENTNKMNEENNSNIIIPIETNNQQINNNNINNNLMVSNTKETQKDIQQKEMIEEKETFEFPQSIPKRVSEFPITEISSIPHVSRPSEINAKLNFNPNEHQMNQNFQQIETQEKKEQIDQTMKHQTTMNMTNNLNNTNNNINNNLNNNSYINQNNIQPIIPNQMRMMEIEYSTQETDDEKEVDELLNRMKSKLMGNYFFVNTSQVNNILELLDQFMK